MQLNDLEKEDIYLEWGSTSFSTFLCRDEVKRQFYDFLSITKNNVAADLVRLGVEDAKYRYFDPITYTIARGHIKYAFQFAKEKNLNLIVGENMKMIIKHRPKYDQSFFHNLPLTIGGNKVDPWVYPYEYQGNFIDWALTHRSGVGISATGSGKTLISYCIIRYLQNETPGTKILFIVPNITLVKQGFSDFNDFSETDKNWNAEDEISMLHGTVKDKTNFKNILITTWQSLKGKRKKFYENYNHVIVDEVHGADADVLKKSIEKCDNAFTKLGMTGSLKGTGAEINSHSEMVLQGLFGGRIKTFSTARMLIDRGVLPELKILVQELKYASHYGKHMASISKVPKDRKLERNDYLKLLHEERSYVASIKNRKEHLNKLYDSLNGNVIVFFNNIETLKLAYDTYEGNKDKFIIYGNVKDSDRESILYDKIINNKNQSILFATYGTLSTGISVNVLDIAVMAESMKSRVKVLQSIGRLLRGDRALVIDLWDNLNGKNYLWKHAQERKLLYHDVEYPYYRETIKIFYP